MAEGGSDFELFTGPAPSEQGEMSDEQFQEEMRRTQAAVQQLQQEEGQAKAYDNSLAQIIVQFLSQPQNTDLFLLISRVVAQNIPSELIIAVLSLIDQNAEDEVKGFLAAGKAEVSEAQSALTIHQKADFQTLDPEHKKAIDEWVQNLFAVASKKPHRVLETLVIPKKEREISPIFIQLSAFVLRKYLENNGLNLEFQVIHDFMLGVFVEIVKNLENLVKEQKRLES